jgi:hypothetical protein
MLDNIAAASLIRALRQQSNASNQHQETNAQGTITNAILLSLQSLYGDVASNNGSSTTNAAAIAPRILPVTRINIGRFEIDSIVNSLTGREQTAAVAEPQAEHQEEVVMEEDEVEAEEDDDMDDDVTMADVVNDDSDSDNDDLQLQQQQHHSPTVIGHPPLNRSTAFAPPLSTDQISNAAAAAAAAAATAATTAATAAAAAAPLQPYRMSDNYATALAALTLNDEQRPLVYDVVQWFELAVVRPQPNTAAPDPLSR